MKYLIKENTDETRKALHLSYATLVTYVPVFGAEQFCSNWFKLVSAHPPHSQTINQKRKLCCCSQDFLMSASLKGTRKQPLVFHRGGINAFQKYWGKQHAFFLSTLKNFTEVAALAAYGGFS